MFNPQTYLNSQLCYVMLAFKMLARQRQENLWGSLIRKSGLIGEYQVPVSVDFTTVERQPLKKVLCKCMQARTYAPTYTQIKYAQLASIDALRCPLSQLLFQVKYLLFPTLGTCKSTKITTKYICIGYLSLEKLIS